MQQNNFSFNQIPPKKYRLCHRQNKNKNTPRDRTTSKSEKNKQQAGQPCPQGQKTKKQAKTPGQKTEKTENNETNHKEQKKKIKGMACNHAGFRPLFAPNFFQFGVLLVLVLFSAFMFCFYLVVNFSIFYT